jgi:hypothetical protein
MVSSTFFLACSLLAYVAAFMPQTRLNRRTYTSNSRWMTQLQMSSTATGVNLDEVGNDIVIPPPPHQNFRTVMKFGQY